MTSNDIIQQAIEENVAILQELDLGCHTLFLMSDGSIDLLANDSETPCLAENALHLDSDETYRLFISLHEQFKQQNIHREVLERMSPHRLPSSIQGSLLMRGQ